MSHYTLWCGRDGFLGREVQQLKGYLRSMLEGSDLSIELRAYPSGDCDWLGAARPSARGEGTPGTLTLSTSGTTGEPKPVSKSYRAIFEGKRGRGSPQDVWLLTYSPSRWAGISLITHVLKHASPLVVPASLRIEDLIRATGQATHLSLTPSLFRKMLIAAGSDALRPLPFRQITFGGEYAPQAVLDRARELWPEARITHTYASTEAGDICSCSDGREGFPRRQFENLRLSPEGELVVDDLPSGDFWECRGARYHFVGRRDEIAKVAGHKVSLSQVEDVAAALAGIQQVRCYWRESPVTGHLIGLDYVGALDRAEVLRRMRATLPKPSCPSLVRRVSDIELTEAGKISRAAPAREPA